MLQSKSRSWVEIDLQKIKDNYQTMLHHIHKNQKIMAVVKADCYGHGDAIIAKVLEEQGVDYFAVSSIDEALNLRHANIKSKILILGYTPNEHFHYLHEYVITQCVMSYEYAKSLSEYATLQNTQIEVHIKVDTGMGRIGIPCFDNNYQIDIVKSIYDFDGLSCTGIFSHFSVADTYDSESDMIYTNHQIELYERVLKDLRSANITYGLTHIQNSYGAINYPNLDYDYSRVGILLVGSTSNDSQKLKYPVALSPSLEWKANVSCVKTVPENTYIGYGRNYITNKKTKIVTVSCGYADGVNRQASHHHLEVLLHGIRCEIIGNICMDQFMIDATKVANVVSGDVVTIVGSDGNQTIKIDELSRAANTINNESFCLISKRIPRFYK